MSITELSIKRPSLVIVVFTILTLFGIIAFKGLGYELIPKVNKPGILISTTYPGASPNDVENSVTKKIEDAVFSINGIDYISSTSVEGASIVNIQLKYGTNADFALQDAQRSINAILSNLPKEAKTPVLKKQSIDDLPVLKMGVASNMAPTEFYQIVNNEIKNALYRVKGVGTVNVIGGNEREIQINIFPNRLSAFGLTINDIKNALATSNTDYPVGNVQSSYDKYSIKLNGKFNNIDDVKNLIVGVNDNHSPVYLYNVAEVRDFQKDSKFYARINTSPVIGLEIIKLSDANAVAVIEEIKKACKDIEKNYSSKDLKFSYTYDSSIFTLDAAESVIHDLILAVILVAVIMFLFLHSFRNAVVVMISIPACLISAFTVMSMFGYTLNLMTLLGMTLVIGILVDDSIVVLENIFRHMEMGKKPVDAAIDGIKEIGLSATAITLVIVVVFLPLAFLSGTVGDVLRPFSVVVAATTLLSLFVAFTVTAVLVANFGKHEHLNPNKLMHKPLIAFEKFHESLENAMTGLLEWGLRNKTISILSVVVLLFLSLMLLSKGFISSDTYGKSDSGQMEMEIQYPKNISLDENNSITKKIEALLCQQKEIVQIYTVAGKSIGVDEQGTTYKSDILMSLVEKKQREDIDIFAARIRRLVMSSIPGVVVRCIPIPITGNAKDAKAVISILASNRSETDSIATVLMSRVKKVPGISDIRLSSEAGKTQFSVSVDRFKMTTLGVNLGTVGQTLGVAFYGNTDSKYREGKYEFDINLRYDAYMRKSKEDIANISIKNAQGQMVKLGSFAEIKEEPAATSLLRRDRNSSVQIKNNFTGISSGDVIKIYNKKFAEMNTPSTVSLKFEGDMGTQGETFTNLGMALLLSIVLVYFLMVALYDNFATPFVVLFSIPLSLIGALMALAIVGRELSIFSILGIIMLVGLVSKNAILVVDFVNQLKAAGMATQEALVKATRLRFRPIFMTTIAMVIGMVPVATSQAVGSEWKQALGWVLIGGLISSMFLTLVIVPIMYLLIEKLTLRFSKKTNKLDTSNNE